MTVKNTRAQLTQAVGRVRFAAVGPRDDGAATDEVLGEGLYPRSTDADAMNLFALKLQRVLPGRCEVKLFGGKPLSPISALPKAVVKPSAACRIGARHRPALRAASYGNPSFRVNPGKVGREFGIQRSEFGIRSAPRIRSADP